jgi:putative MATE family efflux protein
MVDFLSRHAIITCMARTSKTMDMVHGPLLKNIFLFSLPLMVANLLQIAFNAADTIVVGKFTGQEALAAVGAVGPIVNLITSLFNGLSIGANIVIANRIGSGKKDTVSAAVHTSYFMALAGGVLLTVIGLAGSGILLRMMGTPSDVIDLSALYTRIYFIGSIPLLVYDFGASVLRAKGDTARPTAYLMASGILNVILNLFFVISLHMGVAGVAIATVISETLSAVLVTIALLREKDSTRLIPAQIRPYSGLTREILQIGIPAGLQSMMWSISNVAVQTAVNSFGSVTVAGNSAAQNIEGFVYVGMGAFSQAGITFTSQNAGAGEKKHVKKLLRVLTILMIVVSWAVGALAWYFGRFFLSFYTNDSAVIDAGMVRMWYVVFWLWINGMLDIPANSMRGMGYSTTPTILMFLGVVGVRLLYIATVWRMNPTLEVLYFCFPLSWVITSVLQFGAWRIIYRRWARKV